jgi:hypothetical protein
MIRRSSNPSGSRRHHPTQAHELSDIPPGFYQQKIKEALGAGVEALNDPDIEEKVKAYIQDNPTYSRDALHVAAVACQFKREKGAAHKQSLS